MTRTPGSHACAFALLATQLLGGVAGIAHARERLDAPRGIEAAQHEHCPVLHDAAVCVLCSFSHNRAAAPAPRVVAIALPAASHTLSANLFGLSAASASRTGDARAPPYSQG